MSAKPPPRIALLSPGDRQARQSPNLDDHRLKLTAQAFRAVGLEPELAIYNDEFDDEVYEQLIKVDAALVWLNPIEGGRDRTKLDAMLEEIAAQGTLVSAHPKTIQKMGTKAVLFETRNMSWDADFFFGPKTPTGEDSYVLCEINVSSVYPVPDDALEPLALATKAKLAKGH